MLFGGDHDEEMREVEEEKRGLYRHNRGDRSLRDSS
jgi:hypothetical protein